MRISKKSFDSTRELLKAATTAEHAEFLDAFEKKSSERQIIKNLMALRASQYKSQKDVAEYMKCTQSRVSKLEAGKDDDLRLGDLHGYLNAIGWDVRLVVAPKDQTLASEIKYHWHCLSGQLQCLSNLCKDDAEITSGVARLYKSLADGFVKLLTDFSAKNVISKKPPKGIEIEVYDGCGLEGQSEFSAALP